MRKEEREQTMNTVNRTRAESGPLGRISLVGRTAAAKTSGQKAAANPVAAAAGDRSGHSKALRTAVSLHLEGRTTVALQQGGRLTEARDIYISLLRKNPQSEETLANLVALEIANKNYEAVREHSERLLAIRPHSQAALAGLATSAFSTGDFDAAAKL